MKVANKKIAVICMGILLVFALAIGLFTQSIVAQGETAADSQALLAGNWMTEGFAPEQTENGLQLKSTARYKNPIDMQSGYLRLELSLDNPDTVDFVFVLSRTDDDAWGWCAEPANGLYLRIMGDAGTIRYCCGVKENSSWLSQVWDRTSQLSAGGSLILEIYKNGENAAIHINGQNIVGNEFDSAKFSAIMNENGQSYLVYQSGSDDNVTVLRGMYSDGFAANSGYIEAEFEVGTANEEGFVLYITPSLKNFGWCEEPQNGLFARFKKGADGNYELYLKLSKDGDATNSNAWGHPITLAAGENITLSLTKEEDGTARILINGVNYFTNHFAGSVYDSICSQSGAAYVSCVMGAGSFAQLRKVETVQENPPLTSENWSTIYKEEGGAEFLVESAYYKKGLNLSGGHIRVSFNIEKFTETSGTRIGFAFMNTPNEVYGAAYCDTQTPTATGLVMWFSNNGGTLGVNMCNVEKNRFDFMALNDSSDYAATGTITIDLYKNGDGMKLFINNSEYTKSSFSGVLYESLVDANGITYFSYDAYSDGVAADNTMLKVLELTDTFPIEIEVKDFGTTAIKDRAFKLPKGYVDGDDSYVNVKVEMGETELDVSDYTFIPVSVGECVVTYYATIDNVYGERSFVLTVYDAQESVASETLKDPNNWVGTATATEEGIIPFDYAYYKNPLSLDDGYISMSFAITALSNKGDNDSWICFAFITAGSFTSPAGFASEGLYFWFGNASGSLSVSAAYKTGAGVEYILQAASVGDFEAVGDHKIDIMVSGQGLRLFVDNAEISNESVEGIYVEDLVDANNCMFLSVAHYIADGNREDAACEIYSLSYVNDKDLTPPVISVGDVQATGRTGEEITLPEATATDDVDGTVICMLSVTAPDEQAVSVINGKFTPEMTGRYIVTYTATDSSGNIGTEVRYIDVEQGTTGGCTNSLSVFQSIGLFTILVTVALTICVVCRSKRIV